MDDFLAPPGAEQPKCDFDDPSMVFGHFCLPRGGQMAPFRLLCVSWAPLGPTRVAIEGSTFRLLGDLGRRGSQSVISSTLPMVFAGFCHHQGCPKATFFPTFGLLGRAWAPQEADLGPSGGRFSCFCCFLVDFRMQNSRSVNLSNPPWFWLVF